jgi:hypothetical protein
LAAANDLTAREKEEAGLEERKKYTMSQAKKLKKSVDDVSDIVSRLQSIWN